MKCAACQNMMIKKKGEIDLRINGTLYLVRNALFEECSACGERVISPKVAHDLYDRIKNREFVEKELKIPVLEGSFG